MSGFDNWITIPKPNSQADLRLFCFPYAGGNSTIFHSWLNHIPNNIEICSIELPGRGSKIQLAPLNRLEPIVKELSLQFQPYLDKPFAFFGHSMGGLVSFELTHMLYNKYGVNPVHLLISARRAPQLPNLEPPIHSLPESEFISELRRYNGTPTAVLEHQELMELFLPMLRADFAVLETYIYHHTLPLKCPISVFGGLQDSRVSVEQLEAWREQTNNHFSLHMLSGEHFFINDNPAQLLNIISTVLNQSI